jgi:hypothetical protein
MELPAVAGDISLSKTPEGTLQTSLARRLNYGRKLYTILVFF